MKVSRRGAILLVVLMLAAGVLISPFGKRLRHAVMIRLRGGRTVSDVVRQFGPAATSRLRPFFESANVPYPPERIALLAFKRERTLELWVEHEGRWVSIRSWSITAASGGPGPKLRRGDRQVPEGIYQVEGLNPNSQYHLSVKLDYPNEFDRAKAREDGRTDLGGLIFIHGRAVSIGCIAIGDEAIEELFVLAAEVCRENIRVVLAPNDFRTSVPPIGFGGEAPVSDGTRPGSDPILERDPTRADPQRSKSLNVAWIGELYERIGEELKRYEKR